MWEEGAWKNRLWMQIWSFYSPAHPGPLPQPATALLWALPGRQILLKVLVQDQPVMYALRVVLGPSSVANSAPLLAPPFELPTAYLQPWPTLVTPHPTASKLSPHPLGPPCIHRADPRRSSAQVKPELSGSMEVCCSHPDSAMHGTMRWRPCLIVIAPS